MQGVTGVYALLISQLRAPRRLFGAGGGFIDLPVLAFALETAAGWLLVDTGVGAGPLDGVVHGLGIGRGGPSWSIGARLAQLGTTPLAVRGVLFTHLDYDHTGGLPLVLAATAAPLPLYVHAEELAAARAPRSLLARARYGLGRVPAGEGVRPITLDPDPEWGRSADVLGDGTVRLVDLPGHSAGHVGVLVTLAGGGRVLLCGDAAYARSTLAGGGSPELFARWVGHDLAEVRRTLDRLRAAHREQSDLFICPSHEPEIGRAAIEAPVALRP